MAELPIEHISLGNQPPMAQALLDPYEFYRNRARKLAADSKPGLERFAYNVFGPDLMASLVFALDAHKWVRFPTSTVSPINRFRKFVAIPARQRGYSRSFIVHVCSNPPDPLGWNPFQRLTYRCEPTILQDDEIQWANQDPYLGFVSDTTFSSRLPDQDGGEFELFAPHWSSPSRNIGWSNDSHARVYFHHPDIDDQINDNHGVIDYRGKGPGARILTAGIDSLLGEERDLASQYISKYTLSMVADLLPSKPVFNTAYNVGELKDIPMMLRNTVNLFRDPGSLGNLSDQGSQYLNFKFGWESTYRAVQDLLKTPEKVAKKVNWLLSRQGKNTNLHSNRKFKMEVGSVPTALYDVMSNEFFDSSGTKAGRNIELRCALNAKIVLPDIAVPRLREDLIAKAWGIRPTPTDVYNLVPWSWLVDWFSGLGDYLTILDKIHRDKSLFNFGYMSYVSKGHVNYVFRTKATETKSWSIINPTETTFQDTILKWNNNSTLSWRYHKRIDIGTVTGVKTVSNPASLDAGQLAIIGALLTRFPAK